jgi:hypothetical protein
LKAVILTIFTAENILLDKLPNKKPASKQSPIPSVPLTGELIWNRYEAASRDIVNALNVSLLDKLIPIGSTFVPPSGKQLSDCVKEVFATWRTYYDVGEKGVEEAAEKKENDFPLSWLCFILLGPPKFFKCLNRSYSDGGPN